MRVGTRGLGPSDGVGLGGAGRGMKREKRGSTYARPLNEMRG
jgi:hypothetical protein